jgi:hypothetical protein
MTLTRTPKPGYLSLSILNQKNAVVVDDIEQCDQPHVVVDDTEQSDQPPVADDTLSLFGGPDFQEIDDEFDNDNFLENIAQNLSSKQQTGLLFLHLWPKLSIQNLRMILMLQN